MEMMTFVDDLSLRLGLSVSDARNGFTAATVETLSALVTGFEGHLDQLSDKYDSPLPFSMRCSDGQQQPWPGRCRGGAGVEGAGERGCRARLLGRAPHW